MVVVAEAGLAVAFLKIRQQWSLPHWWTLLFTNDFSVVCRADSILFTVEFLSKLESILSASAAALLIKVRQYSTPFVILSTIFTASLPGADYISRNHFLCSFVSNNSSSIQVFCFFFFLTFLFYIGYSGSSESKNLPEIQETWVQSLDWDDSLEKCMATHSSILAWRIPWAEDPGGLQAMGHKESDVTDQLSTAAHSWLTI